MPKINIDYSNCCIYKLEHIENESLIYVGHTTNFKQRKALHKSSCNNDKKINLKLYQIMRENGGFGMFEMIEVEKYPCNDRREAEKRENEVMKELKATMNKIRSFRTEKDKIQYMGEYYEENKDKIKQYREDNKDKIKQYREENKDKRKQYREENKDKTKQYNKEYYLRKKKEEEKLFIE